MYGSSQQSGALSPGVPGSAGEAIEMVLAGLSWLASADVASLPTWAQADVLRGLERALSAHTAARARALAAFTAQAGYEDDGQGSPRTWLKWQTRITDTSAAAAVGWMRRLNAHPAVADALAARQISQSWARQVCDWTDQLPEDTRPDADLILLAAADGGADLADLAALADQIRRRVARPDRDDDGFADRGLRLSTTFAGAGTLRGDLTPRCAAALQAVLDALGKKQGPDDTRSKTQRDHDALEEALRRLIASNCLPDRAGQPTQIVLHMDLDDLPGRVGWPGGHSDVSDDGDVSKDDAASNPARDDRRCEPRPAWPGPAARPGDLCDAQIIPIVTGRVDHDLLDRLAGQLTDRLAPHLGAGPPGHDTAPGTGNGPPGHDSGLTRAGLRDLLLGHAVALLSGPGGLASVLRTGTLPRPAASVSLPLDIGTATDTIPPHLRRAVIARDRRCAAPGCGRPPAACDIHHIIPRSRGGPTSLTNMILLCRFHHLIMVHEWDWTITLNADGTTTMTSPDHTRRYHSHAPPPQPASDPRYAPAVTASWPANWVW